MHFQLKITVLLTAALGLSPAWAVADDAQAKQQAEALEKEAQAIEAQAKQAGEKWCAADRNHSTYRDTRLDHGGKE